MGSPAHRSDAVVIHARGHPLVAATHHKTLEVTRDTGLTAKGTCVVGVAADWLPDRLRSLTGRIRVTLECCGHRFGFDCTVSPTFLHDRSLVFRRGGDLAERTFAFGATASAADVDRALVRRLRQDDAQLTITIEQVGGLAGAAGALYVVGLPIGNEGDLSPRARHVLSEVDVVLAEDTRRYRTLARSVGLTVRELRSHHVGNENQAVGEIVRLLEAGAKMALVTDAGTPVISDPGFALVRAARAGGIPVRPVPGPSAPIAALSAAGIAADSFTFAGFLPRRASARRTALADLGARPGAVVVFEAPHRLVECLEDVGSVVPGRTLCVARELTKVHEEIVDTRTDQAAALFRDTVPRGEYTLVIGPPPRRADEAGISPGETVSCLVRHLPDVPTRALADAVAASSGMSRRDAYRLVLSVREQGGGEAGGT